MHRFFLPLIALLLLAIPTRGEVTTNPSAVTALLQRVANIGSDKITTILDTNMDDNESFVITSQNGLPTIKASSLSALTTGINWYLNHCVHVNISWNNLTTDLSETTLPVPTEEEAHTSNADYRYYLNYCTFSYSMSTWTWDRWQKEIDWMALHGINMPLQIVGLEVVWKDLLTKYYNYTEEEANAFVAGPCFQAWFGMNNLEGWGGPNPDWWYSRQQGLASKILARERALGIEPVLPGFSGMVPHDFESKTGIASESQGGWCNFQRPFILDPTSKDFASVAKNYYQVLKDVMGESSYYSMDPFHEGGRISSGKYSEGYRAIYDAMNDYCGSNTKWVIQQWQWASYQANSLTAVPEGRLLVLDLFSDGQPAFDKYNGYAPQEAIYCTIPNFGGRSGFMGRLDKQMTDYFAYKSKYSSLNGVGATPEAIEQVPVVYDNLYELPWLADAPENAAEWLKDYTASRYSEVSMIAQKAWEKLRTSALGCTTSLQGPHEAVYCARPSLNVGSVSTWGGTDIFYDPQIVADVAYDLLDANLNSENYSYDLVELTRQALSDYSKSLLAGINSASGDTSSKEFISRRDAFLNLILDIDKLLGTNESFRLGHWTEMARAMADEIEGTTEADHDWLELDNARTLITTWGDYSQSEGGLRDYSYRAWQGILKDYYYPRWKYWFDNNMQKPAGGWFYHDWEWAHNLKVDFTQASKTTEKDIRTYSPTPEGNTREVALEILPKYITPVVLSSGNKYYIYRTLTTDASATVALDAFRGETFTMPVENVTENMFTLKVDFNNDGDFSDEGESVEGLSIAVPSNASNNTKAQLLNQDGTVFTFTLKSSDNVTEPRTVSAYPIDDNAGSVKVNGQAINSVFTTEPVELSATPANKYRFLFWGNENGTNISNDNPMTYTLAPSASLWAYFEWYPWNSPEENLQDMSTIQSYAQYVNSFSAAVGSGTASEIYSTATCPTTLYQLTEAVVAEPGATITINWSGNDGLRYCYLSAYLDANSDGSFEKKIGTIGTASSTNANVISGKLTFTAPTKEGTTHARFRFDSAWRLPSGPDYSATRYVYDIPIVVTTTTAITNSKKNFPLQITTTKGNMKISNPSENTANVNITNCKGIVVKQLQLASNSNTTVKLSQGVYLVNRDKYIVR